MRNRFIGEHAAVVGGSAAGLVAAHVLREGFERVTIVERDRFPEGPQFRKGVPQSHHLHALIPGGQLALERLLPGLEAELLDAGAVHIDWPRDVLWMTIAGPSRRFSGKHHLCSISRVLLDWILRRRILSSGRVGVLEGQEATGLALGADGRSVTGVLVRPRGVEGPLRTLSADLVIDASGRNSRAPDWLEALGFGKVAETRIDPFLGYASRVYAKPADPGREWQALYFQARPPASPRMGGLFPIEGDRWLVSLGGAGFDYPPTDEAGFLEFASSLRSPILYQAIRSAEPLTAIRGYRRTENQRRHFDRLARWPERFAIVGDAACAFNPIYGQGIAVAAKTGLVLRDLLQTASPDLQGFSRRLQAAVARCNSAAWLVSTGEDLRYPSTEGATAGPRVRLMHRYLDRVAAVATEDRHVNQAFLDAMFLVRGPASLFRPGVLARVLRGPAPRSPQQGSEDGVAPVWGMDQAVHPAGVTGPA